MGGVLDLLGGDGLVGVGTPLRYGASNPDSIVVLFHGVASDSLSLQDYAASWAELHPQTQFILLQAPHPVGSKGFEWFHYQRGQESEETEEEYVTSVVLPAIRQCQQEVGMALKDLERTLDLRSDRVILAGFGQGAAVAAYVGLQCGVGGVLLMGGPPSPIHTTLLPDRQTAQVMVIAGGNDLWCPAREISNAFRHYTLYGGRVVVLPGIAHRMSDAHVSHASAFFTHVFGRRSSLTVDLTASQRSLRPSTAFASSD